jgi:oxygen-dependent protoporphyrinogen oxidase
MFVVDALVSALPFPSLAQLFPDLAPIELASLYVVNIGFSKIAFPHNGYGYLVPTQENHPLLGMIWDSSIFPQQSEGIRLTAMVRAQTACVEEAVREALRSHLKLIEEPDLLEITKINQSIPQYTLGHLNRLQSWEQHLSGLYLSGAHTTGVSVEGCIARSNLLVRRLIPGYLQHEQND